MTITKTAALAALLSLGLGAAASAQDFSNQIAARQGQFKVLALNLGVLGGMARGTMDYDADMAQAAAANVATVSQFDQRFFWPEGSDNMSLDTTRAQPTIWDDTDDFAGKWGDMGAAATALVAAAGDAAALGAAVGALGGTCQACHEAHRGPELE